MRKYESESHLEDDNKVRVVTFRSIETFEDVEHEHHLERVVLEFTTRTTLDDGPSWSEQKWFGKREIDAERFLEEYTEFTLEITHHYAHCECA